MKFLGLPTGSEKAKVNDVSMAVSINVIKTKYHSLVSPTVTSATENKSEASKQIIFFEILRMVIYMQGA